MANLYAIVSEQFPEFVRNQYPVFVEFIKAYYKWMDENYPSNYSEILDIDQTSAEYIQYFKRSLDVDGILDGIIDKRYLKYIKQIYNSKGSEQALIRILQLVHDADVNIDYPGKYVLRASDGKWNQESFITVETLYGSVPDEVKYFYIDQLQTTKVVYVTRIERITPTHTRLFFKKRTQLIVELDQNVELRDGNTIIFVGGIVKSPASLEIVNGGLGWQLGQIFTIPGTEKNSIGKVTQINNNGTILKASIYEFGCCHTENQAITVYPNTSNVPLEQTDLIYKFSLISSLEGKWEDDSGKISNEIIRLQDNFYYQQFSYVIDSDINALKYLDSTKVMNPAGLKMFTNYNLQTVIGTIPTGETFFPFIELLLGPDFVTMSDQIISKYFTNNSLEELPNADDYITFDLTKYFSDSVSIVALETSNQSAGIYAAEDYFAEAYNAAEITLNIGS